MALDKILPLVGFITVMIGTPGPNNVMLMTSGARFGFRRSIPHILGITFGCQTLILAVALGLDQLLLIYPQALAALQISGCLFLVYLAWMLLRPAGSEISEDRQPRPLTFWQAAVFQWVNPKAWMMIITAIATYTTASLMSDIAIVSLLFVIIGIPLISAWSYAGTSLRDWLAQGRRLVMFNRVMAVLLLASLYPILET